jgi:zinc protease
MFQLKRAVPLAAALVLLASGAAAAAPPPKRAASTRPAPAGLNAIVRLELPNGLRILVLPDSATPMISAGLWIGAGWVHNPRGREGLADLCAATDVRRVRDAVFARQAGKPYLAEALSSKVSADQTVFGVNALAEDLDPALEVLRAAVPAAEEAFAGAPSIKRDALLNLMQSRFDPGLVVREAFAVALFGDRRPLGFSARFQSLVGLMADDVRRFHRDYYLPGNAVLTVAGAARPEAVRAAAARVFGGWAAPTWPNHDLRYAIRAPTIPYGRASQRPPSRAVASDWP